jgi:hypothetical protein
MCLDKSAFKRILDKLLEEIYFARSSEEEKEMGCFGFPFTFQLCAECETQLLILLEKFGKSLFNIQKCIICPHPETGEMILICCHHKNKSSEDIIQDYSIAQKIHPHHA